MTARQRRDPFQELNDLQADYSRSKQNHDEHGPVSWSEQSDERLH